MKKLPFLSFKTNTTLNQKYLIFIDINSNWNFALQAEDKMLESLLEKHTLTTTNTLEYEAKVDPYLKGKFLRFFVKIFDFLKYIFPDIC